LNCLIDLLDKCKRFLVDMIDKIPLPFLLNEIDEIIQGMGAMEIKVKEKDVKKFYEITNGIQFQDIISPEYLMTLLAPLATKIFIKIMSEKNLPKIIGVIHSESEVNFFQPLAYKTYIIKGHAEALQQKTGKMGLYLVLTFHMRIFDQNEEEVADDLHQFFLRIKKEKN